MELLGEDLMAAIAEAEQTLPVGNTTNSATAFSSSGTSGSKLDVDGTSPSSTATNPTALAQSTPTASRPRTLGVPRCRLRTGATLV